MRTIVKEAAAAGALTPAELEEINRFTRRTLTAEEVYPFAVRLCDNHADRDWEFFDRPALEKLAELFVGKTGVFDHDWSARQQTARIYRTELVEEPGVVTEAGEPGCWLKGCAYMLRTPETEGLIAQIEGGILKEVSVSCAVARSVCSVCGAEVGSGGGCGHVRGQVYGDKRCLVRLTEPTDAYEWSFVAVPAQPAAGVVKGWGPALRQAMGALDPAGREALRQLERQAETGRRYLAGLRAETVRLGLLARKALPGQVLRTIVDKLEVRELEALRRSFAKELEKDLALPVQLGYGGPETGAGEDDAPFAI